MNTQPIIVTDGRSERRETQSDRREDRPMSPTTRDVDDVAASSSDDSAEREPDMERREHRSASSRNTPETSYLPEQSASPTNERWQQIQTTFVDDPRKAVTQAHELVGELTQQIVDGFARERSELEQQWSKGEDVSTEDLRVCLQRYRAFFSRLLPSAGGLQHD